MSDEQEKLAMDIHIMLEKMTLQKKYWITKELCRTFDAHGEQLAKAILDAKKEMDATQEHEAINE